MPRREDERQLNLSGKHPAACTCQDCTERHLKGKRIKPGRRSQAKAQSQEKVTGHPKDCTCSSCNLLRSMENLPQLDRGPAGILKRLFGRH